MLRYLVILTFLSFVNIQQEKSETIEWSASRKLTWKDFKGQPDCGSFAVASTSSGISFGYSVYTNGQTVESFNTEITCYFHTRTSWHKREKSNDYILKHEQLHFDITELYTRILKEKIKQLKPNQSIRKQLDRLYKEVTVSLNKTQNLYDRETNHSINKEVQKKWDLKIEKALKNLRNFKL